MNEMDDFVAVARERFKLAKMAERDLAREWRTDVKLFEGPVWPQHRIAWLKGTIRHRLATDNYSPLPIPS